MNMSAPPQSRAGSAPERADPRSGRFIRVIRRLHLYAGLALLPWFLMYGVSAVPFAHPDTFQRRDAAQGRPLWRLRFERPLAEAPPQAPGELREFGRRLLAEAGVEAPNFGVYSPNPDTIQVHAFSFLRTTRIVYAVKQRKIAVEDRRFRFDQFLTGMHARGGFEQDGFLSDAWGGMVDLVSLAMVLWVMTGYFMWWGLARHRRWAGIALLAGAAAFALFTATL
jgi:hypothetical protein